MPSQGFSTRCVKDAAKDGRHDRSIGVKGFVMNRRNKMSRGVWERAEQSKKEAE